MPQPGHTINLHAMPCGGDSEPSRGAPVGAKRRRPPPMEVRATLSCCPAQSDPQGLFSWPNGCIEVRANALAKTVGRKFLLGFIKPYTCRMMASLSPLS